MTDNTYECAICGGVFEKGWSDEEADTELRELFDGAEPEECDLVCDVCFKREMAAANMVSG